MELFNFIKSPYQYVSKNPTSHYRYLLLFNAWLFQGIGNTDTTERVFKIAFDIFLFVIFLYFLYPLINSIFVAILIVVIVTHSINWIINGNIWCLFRGKYGFRKGGIGISNVDKYKLRIKANAIKNGGIEKILIYGSYARGVNKSNSDMDLRVVRKTGLVNAIKVMIFGMKERIYAFINLIPLDMVIIDGEDMLKNMNSSEQPIIIYASDMITE